MKGLRSTFLVLLLSATTLVQAGQVATEATAVDDVVLESFIMRPFGFLLTIVGTGLFIGTSPLTGLASIPPPHDAFRDAARTFVVAPFNFTFTRPFNVYCAGIDVDCR